MYSFKEMQIEPYKNQTEHIKMFFLTKINKNRTKHIKKLFNWNNKNRTNSNCFSTESIKTKPMALAL